MSRTKHLGEFEIIVLGALLRLDGQAYGLRIRESIESRTGRQTSVGAIYTTLSRMEEKGLVESELGPATAARGGRPKRFFRISAAGQQALQQSLDALGNMLNGLDVWPKSTG